MSLRLAFMGTPDFAVPALAAILKAGHRIETVYTRPPRPAGRGLAERRSPVHRLAAEHGLAVRTPDSLKTIAERDCFAGLKIDAVVVVAYGLILPKSMVDGPRLGAFNIHASLLPRWRGAAPIARAIMEGDAETGIAIMRMAEGLDTGPVCLSEAMSIAEGTTAGDLHDRLAAEGAAAIVEALAQLEKGSLACRPQAAAGVTYARKIEPEETRIVFDQSAARVLHHIHGLSPAPGAWTSLPVAGASQRLRILKAERAAGSGIPGDVVDPDLAIACADGAIRPLLLQREGKQPLARAEFLRGLSIAPGTRLG
ncbi:MAG TPA: methionyl-tRNA formyltransferase [Allosphingosinicella sp.]|nr:methionyl-tRNA formyltransferase [Allosphingosinicella sp.]